jgi:hypothetical protein
VAKWQAGDRAVRQVRARCPGGRHLHRLMCGRGVPDMAGVAARGASAESVQGAVGFA